MSTGWIITCEKCGETESFHTGRSTDGAKGEEARAQMRATTPCPKCGSKKRRYDYA